MHVKATILLTLGLATGLITGAPAELSVNNTLTVRDSCHIRPYLGWVGQKCDWKTGIDAKGAGRITCREYCMHLDSEPDCMTGARCLAKDGNDKPGECWCPCGQREICP
ncbi:hypothetical protein SLS58_007490 [Diplodia intermedia]|uniref:Uncharacterized protein n=1 Tax=Diplodia intermedia TaxID=856260 RepID=A0ABR3TKJ4_9PEZI